MTYYYRFTNYEKMALCAFGCPNKEQTIDNLKIAALIAVQEETRTMKKRKVACLVIDRRPVKSKIVNFSDR